MNRLSVKIFFILMNLKFIQNNHTIIAKFLKVCKFKSSVLKIKYNVII